MRTPAAEPKIIDLRTADGSKAVKAEWRYAPVKLVEKDEKGQDGSTVRTTNIEPRAEKLDFDDSSWEVIDAEGLKTPRGAGRLCFAWYRAKITLPEEVEGKTVTFVAIVDDYGEIWVDGKLPYGEGQRGGNVVAGFNAENRVELADPKPGKTYTIAVFAINGPISVSPINRIFFKKAVLEITE
jgi:gluconolactonase